MDCRFFAFLAEQIFLNLDFRLYKAGNKFSQNSVFHEWYLHITVINYLLLVSNNNSMATVRYSKV